MKIHSDLSGWEYIPESVWGRPVPWMDRWIGVPRRLYITTDKWYIIIGAKSQKEGTDEWHWITKHPRRNREEKS